MGHGSDKAPVSSCCPVAAVAPATAHTTNPAWPVSQTPRQPRCTTPTAIQHTTSHNTRAQCAVAHAPACTLAMLVVPLSRLSSRSCQAFPAPTAWRWGTLGATPGRSERRDPGPCSLAQRDASTPASTHSSPRPQRQPHTVHAPCADVDNPSHAPPSRATSTEWRDMAFLHSPSRSSALGLPLDAAAPRLRRLAAGGVSGQQTPLPARTTRQGTDTCSSLVHSLAGV